jgi:N utilization substance protein B
MSSEMNKSGQKIHTKHLGRELAMQYLYSCEMSQTDVQNSKFEEICANVHEEMQLDMECRDSKRAREYAKSIFNAYSENAEQVNKILSERSKNWSWDRIVAVNRNIMRVAVTEMLFFPEVPFLVSIDEAVVISREYGEAQDGNFVNGVLNAVKDILIKKVTKIDVKSCNTSTEG